MGRKQVTKPITVLSGGMDADITGIETTTEYLDRLLYIVKWESGVGNDLRVDVEISQDNETWTALPFAPALTINTASGEAIVQITEMTWVKMRPKVVDLSAGAGAGTITIVAKASTVGA
jgi:hypothetical protein